MGIFGSLAKMAMKDALKKTLKERILELRKKPRWGSHNHSFTSGRITGLQEALKVLEDYNDDD